MLRRFHGLSTKGSEPLPPGRLRFLAMKRILAIVTLGFALLPAGVAFAQDADTIAAELENFGVYVEPALDRDVSRLSASVSRARNAGFEFYVVVLERDPTGGPTTFADSLLNRLGTGTVLVVSETAGMASTEVGGDDIFAAIAHADDVFEDDESYVVAVVDSLTAVEESSGGGSSIGLIVMIVIIGGLLLLVWLAIRRGKKSGEASKSKQVAEARGEIRTQLDAMANILLEITDHVSASDTSQDDTYLRQASATYTEAEEAFGGATDLRALADLSDRIDEARWQLDAAAAIAAGKEPPPKPPREQRYQCFFDPTHPDATETAEITTAAGKKTVRVCTEDAEKLRRGAQPTPRMIDVEGRRVPAPMAPRSHGGGGLDWLDAFSILAGGAGQAASYDWGGSRTTASRRSGTTASRRSGTTASSGSSSPSAPSGGRARGGSSKRRRKR